MAKAFKCDRCNQLFEGDPARYLYSTSFPPPAESRGPGVSVCKGCSNSYSDWWKEGPAKEALGPQVDPLLPFKEKHAQMPPALVVNRTFFCAYCGMWVSDDMLTQSVHKSGNCLNQKL